MYTPGRWRCVPTKDDEYYKHQIEITEGQVVSIAGRARETIRVLRAEATALRARVAQQEAIHHG